MQLLFSALLICAATLHPGSFSRSRIVVEGSAVRHSLRVQVLSLIEALPIDLDNDLQLDTWELKSAREQIANYVDEHYSLHANGASQAISMGVRLMDAFQDGSQALPSNSWLQIERNGDWTAPVQSLLVAESLFDVSAGAHIEYVKVAWSGQTPIDVALHGKQRSHSFSPSGEVSQGRLRTFFGLGVEHILSGYDHLLFLLALLVAVRGLRSLALVISAFTLAHSLTLALAALKIVSLPTHFVELAIALSIVYVALENLLPIERRSLWVEALVFGLLHGLGFAGFLSEALAGETELLLPLAGFNLGVEAGQILAVVPPALLFAWFARKRTRGQAPNQRPRLVAKLPGQLISLVVALFGLYWFLERAGWWPV